MSTAFAQLCDEAQACTRCPTMAGRRRVLSAANGRPGARVLFVAEAPGRLGAERTGVPMTADQSGKRFARLLDLAGLARADVFITNAALCNPRDPNGNNRAPTRLELASCAPWLERTLNLIAAPVVVTLGATALAALARLTAHPYTLRGHVAQPVPWREVTLFPLYHPSPRAGLSRTYAEQDDDWRKLRLLLAERAQFARP